MIFFLCLSYLCILYVIRVAIKDRLSKILIFLYSSYWCFSLVLCRFNPFGLFVVNDNTYYILIGHLFAFILGFILIRPDATCIVESTDLNISKLLKSKFFLICFIACYVFSVYLVFRLKEILMYYSLSSVRGDFTELMLEGDFLTHLFYSLFVNGMYHFCMSLAIYMLYFDRKWKYILLFSSFCIFVAVVKGSRNQIMTFGYYFIAYFMLANLIQSSLLKKKTKFVFSKKVLFIFGIIAMICITIMSTITALRKNIEPGESSISEFGGVLVNYSTGPIVAFDYAYNKSRLKKRDYYGMATFCGTEKVLSRFFTRFTGIREEIAYTTTTDVIQNDRIYIGNGMTWNYAYTSCLYYYWDFGLIGIFLMPFIFGFLVRRFLFYLCIRLDFYNMALFGFISYMMWHSVFSCYLHKNYAVFYMLILFAFSYHGYVKWKKLNVIE